jgi:thioredoxin reductase (NADPH)
LGSFEPRKPLMMGSTFMKIKGLNILSKSREFRKKSLLLVVEILFRLEYLLNVASEVTFHRRNEFRGALDSVEKYRNLKMREKSN